MKKFLCSILTVMLAICMLVMVNAENNELCDSTFRELYNNIYQCLDVDGTTDGSLLSAEIATVWKANEDNAGFMFQGNGWNVYGLADMKTGIIKKVFCRLPYNQAGLLMACAINYTISGEMTADQFALKYMGDDMLLNGEPFPEYENTLDAGSEDAIIFEFTRTTDCVLRNEDNACEMSNIIKSMQE